MGFRLTTTGFLNLIESDVNLHFPDGDPERAKTFALFADVTRTLEDNEIIKAD